MAAFNIRTNLIIVIYELFKFFVNLYSFKSTIDAIIEAVHLWTFKE